jgi:ribonuclease HI
MATAMGCHSQRIDSEMVAQLKLKLDSTCSNNQAGQLAIVKALEAIESLREKSIYPCMATIFTDSRVTLDSLHNANNNAYLVKEIRKRVVLFTILTTMHTFSKRLKRG